MLQTACDNALAKGATARRGRCEMLSDDIEWGRLAFAIFIIIIGLAYIFSRGFTKFALRMTSQGNMWVGLMGPKWAMLVARYVFGLLSIGIGGYVAYAAMIPGHGN